jgi:hypothetical protein
VIASSNKQAGRLNTSAIAHQEVTVFRVFLRRKTATERADDEWKERLFSAAASDILKPL